MSNKNTTSHSGATRMLALVMSILVASSVVTILVTLLINWLGK